MYDVKRQLFSEHEQIEFSVRYLARAARAGANTAALRECWLSFELNLLEHLIAEEQHLFGVAEAAECTGIDALRAEHFEIRRALFELRRSVALGQMDLERLEALRKLLVAHSAHEKRSLYRWLEQSESSGAASQALEQRTKARVTRERSVTAPAIPALMRASHSG